jgi:hypothetical protein
VVRNERIDASLAVLKDRSEIGWKNLVRSTTSDNVPEAGAGRIAP